MTNQTQFAWRDGKVYWDKVELVRDDCIHDDSCAIVLTNETEPYGFITAPLSEVFAETPDNLLGVLNLRIGAEVYDKIKNMVILESTDTPRKKELLDELAKKALGNLFKQ